MEYNTKREPLIAREYGRNIQKMVHYVKSIQDAHLRQKAAESVIETMEALNPRLKDLANFRQRLWDHFFMMANYDIEVSSPYPKPTNSTNNKVLEPVFYPKRAIKYRHLGSNMEALIHRAIAETDPTNKDVLVHIIIQAMKQLYINRYKETPSDEDLKKELNKLSNGVLSYTKNPIYSVFTKLPKEQCGEKQPKIPKIKERKKNTSRHKFNYSRKKRQ